MKYRLWIYQGYILSSDVSKVKQAFTWDGEHDISLIFENRSKVKVQLKKADESGAALAGAVFVILRDGQVIGLCLVPPLILTVLYAFLSIRREGSEYEFIRYPQQGTCLYKCGNERYLLEVIAPEYKAKLFGEAWGR